MIHEICVNGVLEIAPTEVREENIYCFCTVTFLKSCMVLNSLVSDLENAGRRFDRQWNKRLGENKGVRQEGSRSNCVTGSSSKAIRSKTFVTNAKNDG